MNTDINQDKKYTMSMVAGSLLINLVTILIGAMLIGQGGLMEIVGHVMQVMGWLSASATAAITLFIAYKMKQVELVAPATAETFIPAFKVQ